MEQVDLDINNYSLDDILSLFNISHEFTHDDLKTAKKMVLKTHPDKSKLDKEYFLFVVDVCSADKNVFETVS